MEGMDMGGMSMGSGVPSLFHMQRMYWAVVGGFIGIVALVNWSCEILALQRFADSSSTPSKPKSLFSSTHATITAMAREISHASIEPVSFWKFKINFPPLGRLLVVLANIVVLMVFCFYKLNTTDQWSWEDVGYRTGFMAVCQLPLIILLSGKNNIIGLLTGSSYERLNWFHRWIARTLWLCVTIHMGFWFRSWSRYKYITIKLTQDPITQKGFSAWCVLTFIVIMTSLPVRRLSYEVFVIVHLISFGGFIAIVWFHVPDEVKAWVWVPIGLFAFDRITRFGLVLFANLSLFRRQTQDGKERNLWANRATFTPLPGNVTRITIPDPVISWRPGQHVFLSCHSIIPFQNHPFTVASIPSDKKLEFLVRAERGGTRRIFRHASKHNAVLGGGQLSTSSNRLVAIEGPYGRIRSLRQFDSVMLLAGGMGATYTMPLMRDIVEGWKTECLSDKMTSKRSIFSSSKRALTNRIRFLWVIRAKSQLSWFSEQLQAAQRDLEECRQSNPSFNKELDISVYVTCDEELSAGGNGAPQPPLQSTKFSRVQDLKEPSEKQEEVASTRSTSITGTIEPVGPPSAGNSCLPDGGCCCTRKISDENADAPICNCSGPSPPTPTNSPPATGLQQSTKETSLSAQSTVKQAIDTQIRVLSGRPDFRTVIRRVLEQAEGESGVVVCGPRGLSTDVRKNVVSLSDERAVHKGTGAQGIYLHVEAFEY